MTHWKKISAGFGFFATVGFWPAQAQDTFQNLNFEQANPIFAGMIGPWTGVTTASALPDWTVSVGGVLETSIPLNGESLGSPIVSLTSSSGQIPPIDGNYCVSFYSSISPVSISQTGLIPIGSQSLMFKAQAEGFGQIGWEVLIGNQSIPFAPLGTGQNYTLYGADISTFAGTSEQVTFLASGNLNGPSELLLDDISFSPQTIPEPDGLALAVIGGLIFGARHLFSRRILYRT